MQERTIQTADETKAEPAPGQPAYKPLSPRMIDVLSLIAGGKTHDEVAGELGISNSAVRTYVAKARERLGAQSRTEAIVIALRLGQVRT